MNTLTAVTLVVLLVLLAGLILPLRLSWRSKAILAAVVITGMSRNYIYVITGGNGFDPDIPYNLYFVLDLARTTLITLAALVLIRLAINGTVKIMRRDIKASVLPEFSVFHAQLMLLGAFAIACYGTSCAYTKPRINHYQITMERLDPRLDGLRVIMLSDFHISAPSDPSYVADIITRINALNPDLVLLPGDLIDGKVNRRHAVVRQLFDLKAKYGVYITSGNHEYYSGYQQWHDYFVQGGLISLDNKVVALKDAKGKTMLTLGGVTDPKASNYGLPLPDVKGVAAALDDSAPTVILSHRPAYAVDFADSDKKVDLVLSGHTHGGLVLGFNQIVARLNDGFLSGHYRIKSTDLIVSNGIAVWQGYPMRLGVPNEFVVMTLRSSTPATEKTVKITRAADIKRERAEAAALKAREAQQRKAMAEARGAAQNAAAGSKADGAGAAGAAGKSQGAPGQMVLTASASKNQAAAAAGTGAPGGALPDVLSQETSPRGGSPVDASEIRTSSGSVQGLNLILPMVDTESGKTWHSITSLALLPENLSTDQINRINEIINESRTPAPAAPEKTVEEPAPEDNRVHFPDGIYLEVLKESSAAVSDSKAASLGRNQGQTAERMSQTHSSDGKARGTPANPADQSSPSGRAPVRPLTPEELAELEYNSENSTAEIQSEYAISLGNSKQKPDDKGVKDMLEKR